MNNTELLPCPFCGEHMTEALLGSGYYHHAANGCTLGGFEFPDMFGAKRDAWNRRTALASQASKGAEDSELIGAGRFRFNGQQWVEMPRGIVDDMEILYHAPGWPNRTATSPAQEPVCEDCGGSGRQHVGYSGQESDGNAPLDEPCGSCGYGAPSPAQGQPVADAASKAIDDLIRAWSPANRNDWDIQQERLRARQALEALLTQPPADAAPVGAKPEVCCMNFPDDHKDMTITSTHWSCLDCGDSWPLKSKGK